eukprot:1141812-Pelagomonas_calceolata.AAC.3
MESEKEQKGNNGGGENTRYINQGKEDALGWRANYPVVVKGLLSSKVLLYEYETLGLWETQQANSLLCFEREQTQQQEKESTQVTEKTQQQEIE